MSGSGTSPERPFLGVSMGDPLGIGPEVLVRALGERSRRAGARHVVFGSHAAMLSACEAVGVEPFWWRVKRGSALLRDTGAHDVVLVDFDKGDEEWSRQDRGPTRAGGAASFAYVEAAIEAARGAFEHLGRTDGIVTGPISKEAWAMAGRSRYPGHTELLTTRFGAKRTRMMFDAPSMRVVLATAHVPLMEVRNVLTIGRVHDTIDLGAEALRELGVEDPRIGVCGLNPHAGEGGLLGDEEIRVIGPAVKLARESGIDARGPVAGDTVFNALAAGKLDLVVAMYHDQGLIPVKLTSFDCAVNMTLGLETVRTSPDHGTAFGIAGRGEADAGSMSAALDSAAGLARGRAARRASEAVTR